MSYSFLSKLLVFPFFILIISGLIIPSDGQHGALNIKSLALLSSLLGWISIILIKNQMKWEQFKLLTFVCFSVIFLFLWMFIFIINQNEGFNSSFDQFKIFLITLLTVSMSLYFVREKVISFEKFFKVIVFSNFAYSLYKLILITLSILGIIDISTLLEYLGIRVMMMEIYAGINRFQTSVDIITPFLLFFVLQADHFQVHFSKKFIVLYFIISFISIFFSFSRYLIFIAMISLFLHWVTLNATRRMAWFLTSMIVMIGGVAIVGTETINAILEVRFFNAGVELSDNIRTEQIRSLMKTYDEYPIFGLGLGSYAAENIRDMTNSHAYEVQWVAFLMQLGTVGVWLLLFPVLFIFSRILSLPLTKSKVSCALLFSWWVLSGFTNPFLISLTSGIVYSLFILSGLQLKFNSSRLN